MIAVYRPLTFREYVIWHRIKWLAVILGFVLALVGCASPPWAVSNNTKYNLTVYQDGCQRAVLAPGQTITLDPGWREYSNISVSAHDYGRFVGASARTFYFGNPGVWQIENLTPPQTIP